MKLYYKDGYKYQVCRDYIHNVGIIPLAPIESDYLALSSNGWLTIRRGYCWDGASGPTWDSADTMRAGLVHDALYQLMRMGLLEESERIKADQLLHDICLEDGMIPARADLWYGAVRLFAHKAADRGTDPGIHIVGE
jgi:hypothetical protein